MNTYTELRERRHALLFTVEQGCRRQGINHWEGIHRYLLAAMHTRQGRDLLIGTAEVENYIERRRDGLVHKYQTGADRTAERLLTTRDRRLADAFTRLVEALPAAGGAS